MIFINACMRDKDSRTLKLARSIIRGCAAQEINLSEIEDLVPYTQEHNPTNEEIDKRFVRMAQKIADSDGVVIAAPFWDMSFPALLKVFLEKLSIQNVMFEDNGKTCSGIAKCPYMFFVTTRGMYIPDDSDLEQATPYLKALCQLWGIKKFDSVSAYNLDYLSQEEVEDRLEKAIAEGKIKLNNLL